LQEVLKIIEDQLREYIDNKSACFLFDCDADAVYLRSEVNLKKLEVRLPSLLKYINLKEAFEKFYG